MRWFGPKPKIQFKLFEIPTRDRVVRIWLNDGSVGLEDPDGESYWDGWATIDDTASNLARYSRVPPAEARGVAEEAVKQWKDWLGNRPHQYPRPSN